MRLAYLAVASLFVGGGALAATDLVVFPNDYKAAGTYYGTVSRGDNKTVRDFYANDAALAGLKAGAPLPDGAVLVMEVYRAALDGDGNPLKGDDGQFRKGPLNAVFVMEKRRGWGAAYPESLRNGEWEYARFEADGRRVVNADMKSCFACHKSEAAADFVFTRAALDAKAKP